MWWVPARPASSPATRGATSALAPTVSWSAQVARACSWASAASARCSSGERGASRGRARALRSARAPPPTSPRAASRAKSRIELLHARRGPEPHRRPCPAPSLRSRGLRRVSSPGEAPPSRSHPMHPAPRSRQVNFFTRDVTEDLTAARAPLALRRRGPRRLLETTDPSRIGPHTKRRTETLPTAACRRRCLFFRRRPVIPGPCRARSDPSRDPSSAPSPAIVSTSAQSPIQRGSAGLPTGVQIVGRPFREDVVLAALLHVEAEARASGDAPKLPIDP